MRRSVRVSPSMPSQIREVDRISLSNSDPVLSQTNIRNSAKGKHVVSPIAVVVDGMKMIQELYGPNENKAMIVDELAETLMEPRPPEEATEDFKGFRPSISTDDTKSMEVQESDESDSDLSALYSDLNTKKSPVKTPPSVKPFSKRLVPYSVTPGTPIKKVYSFVPDTPLFNTRSRYRSEVEREEQRKRIIILDDCSQEISPKKRKKRNLELPDPDIPEDYAEVLRNHGCAYNKANHQRIGNLDIYGRDFNSLRGCQFLNDVVMDKYFELICIRNKSNPNFRRCESTSVFFACSVVRAVNKTSLAFLPDDTFANELLFIPVNEDNHWYLFVVDFVNLSLFSYDSLSKDAEKTDERQAKRECILNALKALAKGEKLEIDWNQWSDCPTDEQQGPFQNNGSDCGVYVLQYADRISRGVDTLLSDSQMPFYRKRMVYELLQGELLPPSPY